MWYERSMLDFSTDLAKALARTLLAIERDPRFTPEQKKKLAEKVTGLVEDTRKRIEYRENTVIPDQEILHNEDYRK